MGTGRFMYMFMYPTHQMVIQFHLHVHVILSAQAIVAVVTNLHTLEVVSVLAVLSSRAAVAPSSLGNEGRTRQNTRMLPMKICNTNILGYMHLHTCTCICVLQAYMRI